jgi:hypothetical protein
MGKIVISENVSLDGVIEDPTGLEGSRFGGWFWETDRGEDGEKFTARQDAGHRGPAAGSEDLRVLRRDVAIPEWRAGGSD